MEGFMRKYILIAALFLIWITTMFAGNAFGQSITICNINGNSFVGSELIIQIETKHITEINLSINGVSPRIESILSNTVYHLTYSKMGCLATVRAYNHLKLLHNIKAINFNRMKSPN